LYRVRRDKRRCLRCGYEFVPWIVKGLRLKKKDWGKIAEWFLLERSGLWTSKVKPGSKICPDTHRLYTGLAAKGDVHRTVEHRKKIHIKRVFGDTLKEN